MADKEPVEIDYGVFYPEELEMYQVADEPKEGEPVLTAGQRSEVSRLWRKYVDAFPGDDVTTPNMKDMTVPQAERLYTLWGEDVRELHNYGKKSALIIAWIVGVLAFLVVLYIAWNIGFWGLVFLGIILIITIISRIVAHFDKELNKFNVMRQSAMEDIADLKQEEKDNPRAKWYLIHRDENGNRITNPLAVEDNGAMEELVEKVEEEGLEEK